MEKDIINELLKYFRKIDTASNWNIDPDEVVQIVLSAEESQLFEDTICDYIEMVSSELEEVAYNRKAPNFSYQVFSPRDLEDLINLSPYAKRKSGQKFPPTINNS